MATYSKETRIRVRVHPGAIGNKVVGISGDILRLKIAAPPYKGKANKELVTFLSQLLDISPGSINIIKGHTARDKVIAISGLERGEVLKRLLP